MAGIVLLTDFHLLLINRIFGKINFKRNNATETLCTSVKSIDFFMRYSVTHKKGDLTLIMILIISPNILVVYEHL